MVPRSSVLAFSVSQWRGEVVAMMQWFMVMVMRWEHPRKKRRNKLRLALGSVVGRVGYLSRK